MKNNNQSHHKHRSKKKRSSDSSSSRSNSRDSNAQIQKKIKPTKSDSLKQPAYVSDRPNFDKQLPNPGMMMYGNMLYQMQPAYPDFPMIQPPFTQMPGNYSMRPQHMPNMFNMNHMPQYPMFSIQPPQQDMQLNQMQNSLQNMPHQHQNKAPTPHQNINKEKKDFTELENIICFKNYQIVAGLPETIRNLYINQECVSEDLIVKLCKRGIHKLKDSAKQDESLKELNQEIKENIFPALDKQTKKENRESTQKSSNNAKDNNNEGVPNFEFELLKQLHQETEYENIFKDVLFDKQPTYGLDLSYFAEELIKDCDRERCSDLYLNSVKLFKGDAARKLTA